jgi:uncharacterized integral membrane protein
MQVFFLVALVFALLAVMFALQNIVPVTVAFLAWTFEGSLALVLFVALIVGALVSFLASVPTLLKGRRTVRHLKKQIAALEVALENCRREPEAAPGQSVKPPDGSGDKGGRPPNIAPAP